MHFHQFQQKPEERKNKAQISIIQFYSEDLRVCRRERGIRIHTHKESGVSEMLWPQAIIERISLKD